MSRDEREIPLMQRAHALWDQWPAETGADMGFARSGLVYVTKDEKELAGWRDWAAMAAKHQVSVRIIGAEEARRIAPGRPQDWIGGVVSAGDGRAEPGLAASAIARGARAAGASVVQNCAVRGLDIVGGRVAGVVTEHGVVRASTVILAGGAWSSMFLRRHGVDLPMASVHSTVFATTPAARVTPGGFYSAEICLTPLGDGGYIVAAKARTRVEVTPASIRYAKQFWRSLLGNRKLVELRAGRSFFRGPDAVHGRWRFDRPTVFERMRVLEAVPNAAIVEPALREIVAACPELAGIQAARLWAGWIDLTPDVVPVIDHVAALPGLVVASGLSGHGFGIGPAAGELAAQLAVGATPLVDASPFRLGRFG